ncbi:MAG: class I SAM-dependent methyltransferase [Acidimicrobiia bacterium]
MPTPPRGEPVSQPGEQPPTWLRSDARQVFGDDPANYDAGRPHYPERAYELLISRCGLKPGAAALEIGPGTGRVTRRLHDLGATITAVEPDDALASYLQTSMRAQDVTLIVATFEDARLPNDAFDLVVAAMSFHWVDQEIGQAKLGHVLRPGGWAALWWTVLGDPERPDPFQEATQGLLEQHDVVTSLPQPQFELDVAERSRGLATGAGLDDVEAELIPWTILLDTPALRALYGSMIHVRRLPPERRETLLDALGDIARTELGDVIERPLVTAVYTGRKPG